MFKFDKNEELEKMASKHLEAMWTEATARGMSQPQVCCFVIRSMMGSAYVNAEMSKSDLVSFALMLAQQTVVSLETDNFAVSVGSDDVLNDLLKKGKGEDK